MVKKREIVVMLDGRALQTTRTGMRKHRSDERAMMRNLKGKKGRGAYDLRESKCWPGRN